MSAFDSLDKLSACLARLPGIGRRSAERMALKLVRDPALVRDLAAALDTASKTLICCSRCGSVTAATDDPCRLCTSPSRDSALLCVVEDAMDIELIEKSGSFRGRYHALGGRLSPSKGMGPDDLRVKALLNRVDQERFTEIILALSTDVEGDSTASFVAEMLKDRKVKISRLAFGLPAGSGIGYSDPVTLARAFKGRTPEQ
jgi:recombination protein RecR